MRLLTIQPKIFLDFPEVKTFFAVGDFVSRKRAGRYERREGRELIESLSLKADELFAPRLVHGEKVVYVSENSQENFLAEKQLEADGIITNLPNKLVAVTAADCLPVLFYHEQARIVGALHIGWQGTIKKFLQKAIHRLQTQLEISVDDFCVYFGPAARSCCYEVTKFPERAGLFENEFGSEVVIEKEGKLYLDFVLANKLQLNKLGIGLEKIEDSNICTIHEESFPSYRRLKTEDFPVTINMIGRME